MTTTKKRPKIGGMSISFGNDYMDARELRRIAKASPETFVRRISGLVDKGIIQIDQIKDWKMLWQCFADIPVNVTMPDQMGVMRNITTSAFPILTGTLAIAAVNAAYDEVPTIGQDLVEDFDDPNKVTTIAAIHPLDNQIEEVKESEDFPEIGASEETIEIRHKKNGRVVKISAEMILENRVADIVNRVNALGKFGATWVEELTLDRVTDRHGSNTTAAAAPYAYRPNGAGTALYSSTANTPGTRAPSGNRKTNNGFADYTDLDGARDLLAAMKDENGKRIPIPYSECLILCPDALVTLVARTINSEMIPGSTNEFNPYGPRGQFKPARVVSSPKLDDIDSSAWYYGAPKRQFKRKWKMRFEYVTLGESTQAYLQAQVAFQARLAWDVEVGAQDYVFFIQNLDGTTYTP